MPSASYAARQPPVVEGEKPVHVLVTGFGVSMASCLNTLMVCYEFESTTCCLYLLTELFSVVSAR